MTTVSTPSTVSNSLLLMMMMMTVMVCTGEPNICSAITTRFKTQVVCYFEVDVMETAYNFKVLFYSDKYAEPEMILWCGFEKSPQPECRTGPDDVTFNGMISRNVTLTRPAALDKVGGQYVCKLEQPRSDMRFDPCILTFIETPTTPTTTPTTPTTAIETPTTPTTTPTTPTTAIVIIVLGVILGIVLLLLIIILVMVRDRWLGRCRTLFQRQKNGQKNGVNGQQDPADSRLGNIEMSEIASPNAPLLSESIRAGPDPSPAAGDNVEVLRILIMGNLKAGKSSLGNTLLGKMAFKIRPGFRQETKDCAWERAERDGVVLEVTDSPRLGASYSEDDDTWKVAKSVADAKPGFNVVIFAIRLQNSTAMMKEEYPIIKMIKQLFSDEITRYLIIVFNWLDFFEGKDEEESCEALSQRLHDDINEIKDLIDEAEGRYFGMNNKASSDERDTQAKDLIQMMQELVRRNQRECYKTDMTEQFELNVKELVRRKLATNE
ncbi:uncharacterized protein LOC143291725 isoform X2 [Babylonia areolata]|uniref:uncharacterized protein LOC143291725 isoform X2 n=1 Tax=Babylonia areolata TaxID=304850 RepID=UPI003FD5A8BB